MPYYASFCGAESLFSRPFPSPSPSIPAYACFVLLSSSNFAGGRTLQIPRLSNTRYRTISNEDSLAIGQHRHLALCINLAWCSPGHIEPSPLLSQLADKFFVLFPTFSLLFCKVSLFLTCVHIFIFLFPSTFYLLSYPVQDEHLPSVKLEHSSGERLSNLNRYPRNCVVGTF